MRCSWLPKRSVSFLDQVRRVGLFRDGDRENDKVGVLGVANRGEIKVLFVVAPSRFDVQKKSSSQQGWGWTFQRRINKDRTEETGLYYMYIFSKQHEPCNCEQRTREQAN